MASRSSAGKKKEGSGPLSFLFGLRKETVHGILAVGFFVLGVFFVLAGVGKAGPMGQYAYQGITYLLGVGYFIAPTLLLLLSASLVTSLREKFALIKGIGSVIFFVSALGLVDIIFAGKGGVLGNLISQPLLSLLDLYASVIILVALLLIATLVVLDVPLVHLLGWLKNLLRIFKRKPKEPRIVHGVEEAEKNDADTAEEPGDEKNHSDEDETAAPVKNAAESSSKKTAGPASEEDEAAGIGFAAAGAALVFAPWDPPPLSLLERDSGKPGSGDIKANANMIKRCLQNFGIDVEMDEITIGPSVTRYSLKPAEGVKLSRIGNLQDNLSYALAAHPLRIEAPIPGKSLVGIEIPNTVKSLVGLGSLLSSEEYQTSDKPLLMALGKGISGKAQFGNLAKMPHLLIAGATGSGKSVTIHAVINSLLFRNSPENLRFIMIDPKRVELTSYNGIAHLQAPVITDPKKTIIALRWAASEMDRRYDILEKNKVRDIESYHKNILAPAVEKAREAGGAPEDTAGLPTAMPYIVIVVDEIADIMISYPRELEAAIVRLAQMSRAVGIHLILSTQRPSVNVITGLIKANVPARIALQVASQIDSRTILDGSGAENLLGAGDMLFQSAEMSKPIRLQSAFISEREVKNVVAHIKKTCSDRPPSEIDFAKAMEGKNSISEMSFDKDGGGEEDDMYEEARQTVIETRKASTSFLQRKLGIGYSRAAKLIDTLQERGVVGPGFGAKPREVLIESANGGSDGVGAAEEGVPQEAPEELPESIEQK